MAKLAYTYYWARSYSAALPEGGDYEDLPRTVIISILGFIQFTESPEFHCEFRPLEVKRREQLSGKMSLHFSELQKLPACELETSNQQQTAAMATMHVRA